jgi:hypothetical protein
MTTSCIDFYKSKVPLKVNFLDDDILHFSTGKINEEEKRKPGGGDSANRWVVEDVCRDSVLLSLPNQYRPEQRQSAVHTASNISCSHNNMLCGVQVLTSAHKCPRST